MAKAPRNTHNKRSLIQTSMYVTDVVQPEESNRWRSINTHTHTHTHRHGNFHNTEAATGGVLKIQIKVSQNSRENTYASVGFLKKLQG